MTDPAPRDLDPALRSLLGQAFDAPAWHGPNLASALRGVDAERAAWHPAPGRHDIWEIAVHLAYWKYRVLRLLDPDAAPSFDESGSDWFERPHPDLDPAGYAAAWSHDRDRLRAWHTRLQAAIDGFDPARLHERPGRSRHSYLDLIVGSAAHDLYHAGQIRLLRRLQTGP